MAHILRHKKLKYLPQALSLLLLLAVLASLAWWGNFFFRQGKAEAAPEPVAAQDADLSQVSTLFGEEALVGVSQYRLLGVVVAKVPEESIAILGEEGKPGTPIRVGLEVTPGVTVKEVGEGYAVLAEGGKSTRLVLPEKAARPAAQREQERIGEERD